MPAEKLSSDPYVGPRPFERTAEDRQRFFGRDREIEEIVSLILGHPLLLVYAESGAGKTSLFNSGAVPLLEANGFEVLPLARVQGILPAGVKWEQVPNVYMFHALLNLGPELEAHTLVNQSLPVFLSERPRTADSHGKKAPLVIVFDQFEELFTIYPENWRSQQEAFFNQVVKALEDDPLLRIVFVIREDYVAQLDPVAAMLPEKLRIRFRLERLQRVAALQAVKNPVEETGTGCKFAPGVAETLVDELLKMQLVNQYTGGPVEVEGKYVEPVQLQVACRQLWLNLPPETTVIDQVHRELFGNVDDALVMFYEESIRTTAQELEIDEGELRRWFEDELITTMGTRSSVVRGPTEAGGLPIKAVDALDNLHLIRGEQRAGARWYELTHDRLIGPILASNEIWRKNQQADNPLTDAALWQLHDEDSSVLLRGKLLLEAEAWANDHPRQVSDLQRRFLQESQEHYRAELEREAKNIQQLRILTVLLVFAVLVAVAFAVQAFEESEKANERAALALVESERANDLAFELYIKQINIFIYSQDFEGALDSFKQAMVLDPAQEKTVSIIDLKNSIAKGFEERGYERARNGNYEEALNDLSQAVKLSPELRLVPKAVVALEQGRAFARQGKDQEALANFLQANEIDPLLKLVPEAELALQQGAEAAQLDNMDHAAERLQFALSHDPRLLEELRSLLRLAPEVEEQLARTLLNTGRSRVGPQSQDEALLLIRMANALNPALQVSPELEVALERVRGNARTGNVDSAMMALDRALEISPTLKFDEPELAGAFVALANTAFSEQQEYPKILDYLALAAKFNPASSAEVAQLCFNFGQQYDQQGQIEAAEAALRLANELDPSLQLLPKDD